MNLQTRYEKQLTQHGYKADSHQLRIVSEFERLSNDLKQKPKSKGWLWRRKVEPVKGIYIWGGVGRGKTWLMDLFYSYQSGQEIERAHFHSFMRQVHERLSQLEGQASPMDLIGADMAERFRVLCLDEFHVIDIGDAMLMRALLEALERHGITLVTTSNQPPDNLYKNGLQRDSFLPAIEILKRANQVMQLEGETDYRLQLFQASSVYHVPLGEASKRNMQQEFDHLTCSDAMVDGSYEVPGRSIRYIKWTESVIWCDFYALCGPPRWQNDYLELARSHHTVFISDVPRLDASQDDSARRFINLVDVFYDRKVKLVISAEVPPEGLYSGTRLAFEFERTVSRLKEMQSEEYLETPHLG
jgi:cell division protein ZapE